MSADDGKPSWRIPALIAMSGGVFTLVSGLAVNSVQLPPGWKPFIWLLTVVMLIAAVLLAVHDQRGRPAAGYTAIMRRPVFWLVGAVAVGLALVALVLPTWHPPIDPPANNNGGTPTGQPSATGQPATPTASDSPSPAAQPTADPTTPAAAPVVRVRWHGLLVMDCCGGPGYSLDSVPPSDALLGDVQGTGYTEIAGEAMVEWEATSPPTWADCANRLSMVVGQHRVEVRVGSVVCFQTRAGRIGYLTVVALSRSGALDSLTTKVEATVWDSAAPPPTSGPA
ncbi:hypothetical protein Cs7R123_46750 [Catellatospora sp. TT07R-123]|uniref:tripartite tricarboxylate transporter TctB family protein n=1 Tax=Catellatospora sp. TT07R-123 TaxID=2733863 RepID=UPI001B08E055|nr:tripartite tricarboxylate transporter TctB family protein [Catellatospora sp. TT07R-123]GHJ47333.1 hypothetical protein Cs7R123_46750 [Catellatospora sp. TT07R-123]